MINIDVLDSFAGKTALITGGTGLIGRQITRILINAGAIVRIVSLDKNKVHDKAEHIVGDLSDFNFCKLITRDIDFVFHIAGVKGSVKVTKEKPASFFVPLLMMNTNMLESARINNVKKLVYTSSVGAYSSAEIFVEGENEDGPPMDEFPGLAKRVAEQQILAYKIQYGLDNYAIVRPANIYGPGDNFDPENAMVIPTLMHRILNKEDPVIIWGDGSAIRDFAYSKDVAEGIVLALYYGTRSKYVNLGSGIGYSIKELVETLRSFIDFNYVFDSTKPSGFPKRIMNINLARATLGYNPTTTLKEGLMETWDWFTNNPTDYCDKKNYFN
jgi:GDP-L-fucose synthase